MLDDTAVQPGAPGAPVGRTSGCPARSGRCRPSPSTATAVGTTPATWATRRSATCRCCSRCWPRTVSSVHGHFTVGRPATTPRPLASCVYSPQVVADRPRPAEELGQLRGRDAARGGRGRARVMARPRAVSPWCVRSPGSCTSSLGGNIEDGSGLSLLDRRERRRRGDLARGRTRRPGPRPDALRRRCRSAASTARCAHRVLLCGLASPVHAKTGTLDTMRALSGYVADAAGHRVTFAFLVQGPLSSAPAARQRSTTPSAPSPAATL